MRCLLALVLLSACQSRTSDGNTTVAGIRIGGDSVVANDNRIAGGTLNKGVRVLRLEARLAAWRPDNDVDSTVTVQAFAEAGENARIPGPLLRAVAGTEVRISVRNSLPDSTLVVHGLRAGVVRDDTLHVAPGATREVEFRAGIPGTYLYWGTTTHSPLNDRPWRDSQLTGAIIIDLPGVAPDSAERVFVITVLDVYQSDTVRNRARDDVWEIAINGRSWPHTERLQYSTSDTVRWRWINGSYLPHPMHLHGFHFKVLAKGSGFADTAFSANAQRLGVTESMAPGSTFQMAWVPTREGTWLMHCHMLAHIVPFPERPDSVMSHDMHNPAQHALQGMSGLVLGITTVSPGVASAATVPKRHLRVFAQQARADSGDAVPRGYVLQQGAVPRRDSVVIPGTPIILTRGETVSIVVINRLRDATSLHWHGMEVESVFDGVAGWSRTGSRLGPLIAPGDSFSVTITPPRAGTFIYHTHMDEGAQLATGLYGPLLVLEPGDEFDAGTDLVLTLGETPNGRNTAPALNGQMTPRPFTLRIGKRYRLRLINILRDASARVRLLEDSVPLVWRPLARDGANLPDLARVEGTALLPDLGVGETRDFEWTPARAMNATLEVFFGKTTLRQRIRVVP